MSVRDSLLGLKESMETPLAQDPREREDQLQKELRQLQELNLVIENTREAVRAATLHVETVQANVNSSHLLADKWNTIMAQTSHTYSLLNDSTWHGRMAEQEQHEQRMRELELQHQREEEERLRREAQMAEQAQIQAKQEEEKRERQERMKRRLYRGGSVRGGGIRRGGVRRG
ncbi:DASH complex subunit Duo1-domain-containing protein [Yarrowia lipolytica]|jgi:hypothetical protein|uniref:DASH complex subunit DUO1 n=1 Tax=Yarrowia lipolytica TaxID=4952 RepID=A0A371C6B2_YARLL|nr:Hypothetical protein YALI2_B00222g [Yarrowia lipolytica]RDW25844.1 DASH complex subunit Duo1-domain-containing protein [Yarrowia lipolytica]RDW31653.1 DASH complex subunit Duo1-domain-containing protein [Yarrowia lipolytica]RDW36743.1 DASH complex subunit Duo1-domain-containing protein [Yarrowia lipolytica]RDW45582.1 DASH complex subunit Duo1-domain-containing protein [Yarrowia lipolytica]